VDVGGGGGVEVGVAAAGIPQDETITAMVRNVIICLFMAARLYKMK
jgi:hypothetical protein